MSWTADTAPANCTISSYNVFRSATSGFTPSSSNQIASGVTSTSYSDTGLKPATTYYYVVEAVDADGTSTASAQATAETSAASGGSTCHVGYTITGQWPGGFGASITIDNTGTTALSNWTLTWSFANGQTVTQLWNGNVAQSGSTVTVTNMSYNGSIPAGGSYTGVGFNGSWNNTTNAVPTSFAVNGNDLPVVGRSGSRGEGVVCAPPRGLAALSLELNCRRNEMERKFNPDGRWMRLIALSYIGSQG